LNEYKQNIFVYLYEIKTTAMTKMISCLCIGSHKYNIQYVTCLCRM